MKKFISGLFLTMSCFLGASENMNNEINLSEEEHIKAQEMVMNSLKEKVSDLNRIRENEAPILGRWQMFLSIMIPLQMQVASEFGFEKDQKSLSNFNQQFMKCALENPKLKEMNAEKWRFVFKEGFGIENYKEISLEEARSLIKDIADKMMSEQFLTSIDTHFQSSEELSTLEKRKRLLDILLPVHKLVMEEHGFLGEDGYILAQRALLDYYYDPFIMQMSTQAQKVIFERAKL